MNGQMKGDLIEKVESQRGRRLTILRELKIPRSTYYKWRKTYQKAGTEGLKKVEVAAENMEPAYCW